VFVAREKQPPICAKGLLEADQQARAIEENNALYVAMTRAADELVLSAHSRAGNKDDSWWSRLVAHAQAVTAEQTGAYIDETKQAHNAQVAIKRLPKWHARPVFANGASSAKPTAEQDERARLGQAMHQLLEWLPAKLDAAATLWRPEQLQRVQSNWQLSGEALELAHKWAGNIAKGEGAWAWQDGVVGFAGNEVDIMVGGALMRLDRLVQRRDTSEWWVLDFKSSHQPQLDDTLLRQLETYRAAVASIYQGQVVRSAFLTANGALVEPAQ
jgi:ATP-dependent helicase/nuclease subunit A